MWGNTLVVPCPSMKIQLFFALWGGFGSLVFTKIHNAEHTLKVWPKFDLLCTKIRVRKEAQKFYGSCRPLPIPSAQSTDMYKQLETQLIYELKFYQIGGTSADPIEEGQVESVLNQTLTDLFQGIRFKLLAKIPPTDKIVAGHAIDSLIQQAQDDKISPFSHIIENLKVKIRNSLIVSKKQDQLPEIVIWRQLGYLQHLWTKHAYFQLANYLSQYDLKLKERLSAADAFKFNNNRNLLIKLFKRVHSDHESSVQIGSQAGTDTSVESRVISYLSNHECEKSFIAKARALLNRHHYTVLVQCLFPNASNAILRRYRQIAKNVVMRQHDFVNILNLIDEGWMRDLLGHPCQHESTYNLRYLKSAQQSSYVPNRYFVEDDLFYKPTRLGRRKSPYYYVGTSHSKPIENKYQSYFTQLADL